MKENNKGFTLIELIIALTIVTIVSVAVFSFAIVSSRTYQKQTKEVELQYESQLAMNQVQELLIDANRGVAYSYNAVNQGTAAIIETQMVHNDSEIPAGTTVETKEIAVCNQDKYYVIQWVADEHRLYYYEYKYNSTGYDIIADKVLMAEYVQSFSADLADMDKNGSISLDVVFRRDNDYRVTQNVKLRNKVGVNKALSVYYP